MEKAGDGCPGAEKVPWRGQVSGSRELEHKASFLSLPHHNCHVAKELGVRPCHCVHTHEPLGRPSSVWVNVLFKAGFSALMTFGGGSFSGGTVLCIVGW